MFIGIFTNPISIAKKVLVCFSVLFFLAGCDAYDVGANDDGTDGLSKPGSPEVTLTSDVQSIGNGGSITLSWSSSNTSSCAASGDWAGDKGVSGSWVIDALTSDSSFSLSCSGIGGTADDSVSVTVNAAPAPTVALSASPMSVAYSGSTQLSWVSSNADSCVASGSWSGSRSTSGSNNRNNLTTGKTYTLTCSGAGGSASDSVRINVAAPSAPATPTVNLSASPSSLPYGGSTTLSWSSENASECTASGNWSGSKSTSGSNNRNNLTTGKTYTLTCSGPGGSASDSVSINVAAPSVPTVNLSASPLNLPYDGSTTLSWSSENASECTASGNWSGSKSISGSNNRNNLTSDKTYTLTCSGAGGSASDSVSISVAAAPSVPTVSLSASPSSLPYDGSTNLSWSSENASECTASGSWSGSKSISGSNNRNNLTTDKTYTLTCSGAGGSASDSVSITVAAPPVPAPTLSFSASPGTVSQNGSTSLSWNTTDATSCTATGDWSGSKGASGSETINSIMIDGQFTLTCSGPGGSVNDSVNVTVVQSSNGTALLSWTPPTENTDNSALIDLAGYKIYYGTSPGNYNDPITINNPGLTSYLVEDLASSNWYFVMTSFNSSGIESSYSMEVSKTIN